MHQNEVQLDQFWHGSLRFLILVHSKSFAIDCVSGDGPKEAIVAGMSHSSPLSMSLKLPRRS